MPRYDHWLASYRLELSTAKNAKHPAALSLFAPDDKLTAYKDVPAQITKYGDTKVTIEFADGTKWTGAFENGAKAPFCRP